MDKNSNIYTMLYTITIVVVIGALLAVLSIVLRVPQEKNVEIEKKVNILKTLGKGENLHDFSLVEKEYDKYITDSYLVNYKGERIEGDAFNFNLKTALSLPKEERIAPVFVSKHDGETSYVFPLHGKGLWGPLWGYIAVNSDFSTIIGANFDHKGETPGLGAEISTPQFQEHFDGKKLFEGDIFHSIKVVKPGHILDDYSVDGISGGTITSEGLQNMIHKCLSSYEAYFKKVREENKKNNVEKL